MGQVLRADELAVELSAVRDGKKVVFTNGCFDILHIGHASYLKEARDQGDLLVVAVNSDVSVKKIKGDDRPIQNEQERAHLLAALACVDYVTFFDEDTPLELIKSLMPDVLVKGGDWTVDQIVGSKEVMEAGGEAKSLKFVSGFSTTNIIEKILEVYRAH